MPKTISIHAANLLFLIVLALVTVVGSALQQLSTGAGLFLTELLLILLPALLFLRREKLSFLPTVRFNFPGLRVMFLALVAGAGFTFFSAMLAALTTRLLGYTFQMPEGIFSANPVNALLVFTSLAVLAPICEETLFRGVLLPAYERYGSLRAILLVGFTFALFHLSMARMLALIPVALVLTWVAWRTRSVVTSMLMHFSYNWISAAALFMVSVYGGSDALARAAAGSPTSLDMVLAPGLFGLLVGAVALLGIELAVRRGESPSALLPAAPNAETRLPLKTIWALLLAVALGLGIAVTEMIVSRGDLAATRQPLALSPGDWTRTEHWEYRLVNKGGEVVGDAACVRFASQQAYRFNCTIHQQAFELTLPGSFFKTDAYENRVELAWARDDLRLVDGSGRLTGETRAQTYTIEPIRDGLALFVRSGDDRYDPLPLPAGTLLADDWAWRLQAMDFSAGLQRTVRVVYPLLYVQEESASRPVIQEGQVRVARREPVSVPALGEAQAWRVEYGDKVAWYALDGDHTLLKLDNGFVTFELTEDK